ncbi:Fe-S cluster domain-containing protein [Bacteroidales bacterium OttesenSCG-928-I21]|nr:Fe-S cluster domain-containing protein [Bacteroidales bacterium OttesenSCG-928-I21]
MSIILNTLVFLSLLGVVLAIILYFVAQKFKVYEDPRIDEVEEFTPGANCGGCGYPGCRGFAEACVKAETLDGIFCPAGGNEVMLNIAKVLGMSAVEKDPEVAVVKCNGSLEKREKTSVFDGPASCAIEHSLYTGDTNCPYGCLGQGDCVVVCLFDAIYIDEESGLPLVDEHKCTACGACVKACPRNIIELRKKGKKERRIYVSCINKDKGPEAKNACNAACIGCGKCVKTCQFEAITLDNFLAYIDDEKCKLCRKCVAECPTGAILEVNFPPRKLVENDKIEIINT